MEQNISRQILSDIIIWMKYARFLPDKQRRETWDEIVTRNIKMHQEKVPDLADEIAANYTMVREKKILPSMRSMQFGGKPIFLNPARLYNCSFLHMNYSDAFKELMFLLLSGCGVGYSVQQHHVDQLPEILKPIKSRRYLIADSIEGWADAVGALVSAYFGEKKTLPIFDFSDIRPKGVPLKTSGGVAPGPEPLRKCLHNIRLILDRKKDHEKLTTLEVHDINCHLADAVRSGGIRRSAMIALFSFRDEKMRTCKFGHWDEENPQRARANNSAVILRHKITEEEFWKYWEVIQNSGSGEPGIFFTNDQEIGTNPCGEVSLKHGQFCNLATVNVNDVTTQEELNARVKVAAFIATIQSLYTDFHYLGSVWQETTEKDRLIGVSLSGLANTTVLSLNLKEAAKIVNDENKRVAGLLGINPASRTTVVKPDGTSSLVLGGPSGIHPWYSQFYIRRIRVGKQEPIYDYLVKNHPELIEDDYFQPTTEAVVSVPIRAPESALFRTETALQFLDRVGKVFKSWIKGGHNKGHNYNNISCTVNVKDTEWNRVGKWMWDQRDSYNSITVFPQFDHTYKQAPFEEITEGQFKPLFKLLQTIDLTKVQEFNDNTELQENVACFGNSCEIV